MSIKKCSKCKNEKLISYFNKNTVRKDGLDHYCKLCRSGLKRKKSINTESRKIARKKWAAKNPGYHNSYHKAKRIENPIPYRARVNCRRRTFRQATPKWLSKEQRQELKQFYKDALELSWMSVGGLEVDHIVPLQGKNVSGLHVPWNLQIIPTFDNRSKGNKVF